MGFMVLPKLEIGGLDGDQVSGGRVRGSADGKTAAERDDLQLLAGVEKAEVMVRRARHDIFAVGVYFGADE